MITNLLKSSATVKPCKSGDGAKSKPAPTHPGQEAKPEATASPTARGFTVALLCAVLFFIGESTAAASLGGDTGPQPCAPLFLAEALNEAQSAWLVNGLAVIGLLVGIAVGVQKLAAKKDDGITTLAGQPIKVEPAKSYATTGELAEVASRVDRLSNQMIPRDQIVTHKDLGKATAAIIAAGETRVDRIAERTEESIAKMFKLIVEHERALGTHDGLLASLESLTTKRKAH